MPDLVDTLLLRIGYTSRARGSRHHIVCSEGYEVTVTSELALLGFNEGALDLRLGYPTFYWRNNFVALLPAVECRLLYNVANRVFGYNLNLIAIKLFFLAHDRTFLTCDAVECDAILN